jgi:3-keto-5-aminohexanoate cleavage enzyme
MQPLMITATPNISWLHPEVDYPKTPQAIALEAQRCRERGAVVLHTHAEGRWEETLQAIRAGVDMIVQCGMSSLPLADRLAVFSRRADMISVILNHHDEAFAQTDCLVLHPREELAEYARRCRQYGVVPEFEVWHAGSVWNLNYLIERDLVSPPFVTTLFFGWPGGTWSPPTVDEYLYRRRLMPAGCVCCVSVMGEGQQAILAAAIAHGDHVRVGTEDNPFDRSGEVADTADLVGEVAEMARAMGRPLATVAEGRRMIGQGG